MFQPAVAAGPALLLADGPVVGAAFRGLAGRGDGSAIAEEVGAVAG